MTISSGRSQANGHSVQLPQPKMIKSINHEMFREYSLSLELPIRMEHQEILDLLLATLPETSSHAHITENVARMGPIETLTR